MTQRADVHVMDFPARSLVLMLLFFCPVRKIKCFFYWFYLKNSIKACPVSVKLRSKALQQNPTHGTHHWSLCTLFCPHGYNTHQRHTSTSSKCIGKLSSCGTSCIWNNTAALIPLLFCLCTKNTPVTTLQKPEFKVFRTFKGEKTKAALVSASWVAFLCRNGNRKQWHTIEAFVFPHRRREKWSSGLEWVLKKYLKINNHFVFWFCFQKYVTIYGITWKMSTQLSCFQIH